MNVKKIIAGAAIAGGLVAGPLALAGTAFADPAPVPLPPAGEHTPCEQHGDAEGEGDPLPRGPQLDARR